MAPIFLRSSLQLRSYANTALLQCCYSCRNFGATATVSLGNGTVADDDNKMQVDSLKKGKGEGQKQTPKPERNPHKQHEQHRHQHVQELWQSGMSERLFEQGVCVPVRQIQEQFEVVKTSREELVPRISTELVGFVGLVPQSAGSKKKGYRG